MELDAETMEQVMYALQSVAKIDLARIKGGNYVDVLKAKVKAEVALDKISEATKTEVA